MLSVPQAHTALVAPTDVPDVDEEQYFLHDIPFAHLSAPQQEELNATLTPFSYM